MSGLAPLGLAYLSVLHADPAGDLIQDLRRTFGGTFIINSGFSSVTTRDEAVSVVEDDIADLVAVGRPAIANPDLVTPLGAGRRRERGRPGLRLRRRRARVHGLPVPAGLISGCQRGDVAKVTPPRCTSTANTSPLA